MSKITLMSTEVAEAPIEKLAQSILDNCDGTRMGDSFVRVAAVELAKRVLPEAEPTQLAPQNPIYMDAGGGKAPASKAEQRINQATYDALSGTFTGGGNQ